MQRAAQRTQRSSCATQETLAIA